MHNDANSPMSIGSCATLACVWEVTAPKPGNVYRGADFEDLSFTDFLTAAAVIGPVLEQAPETSVGQTVLAGIHATQRVVATNVNLGILLLLTPLAARSTRPTPESVTATLAQLTADDTADVYEAIRLARPGGLGTVAAADVRAPTPANLTLRDAMQLAAEHDMVARQYVENFELVFWLADRLAGHATELPLGTAIVEGYLELLARRPDTLIWRKCGPTVAREASFRAAKIIEQTDPELRQSALADFDFWLRSDGHRRNPGTSADLVAAALFVLLRHERINFPVQFS